jgi:hypothetical protein
VNVVGTLVDTSPKSVVVACAPKLALASIAAAIPTFKDDLIIFYLLYIFETIVHIYHPYGLSYLITAQYAYISVKQALINRVRKHLQNPTSERLHRIGE